MAFTEAFPIITVADLPAALAFYRDQLGFRVAYQFPPEGEPVFVTLKLGTSELGIGTDENAGFELCVYADDCDAAVAQLREAGAEILEEPVDQPWGERMARLRDPAGHRILLLSRLDAA
jgi:lactoylglutathione lyase